MSLKSNFYDITSTGADDFQPIDLDGALEVVFTVGSNNGRITDDPYDGGTQGISIKTTDPPLVVHSTDDRLFFVSDGGGNSTLNIWVMRRRA